jgi:hypothetical protein
VSIHKLLLGTHTSDGEQNYLMVADVSHSTTMSYIILCCVVLFAIYNAKC